MGRTQFLLWRIVLLIPTVVGLTILTFIISRVVPADPAKLAAGPRATPDMVETIRSNYGLDKPLIEQYVIYIGNLLQGDFGESILTQHKVADDLQSRFPATLELVIAAMLIAAAIGVPLGIISAIYRNRWPDQVARVFAISSVSIPAFWFAIILQLLLASNLGLLPLSRQFPTREIPPDKVTGFLTIDSLIAGDLGAFSTAVQHLIMPATVLAIAPLAIIMRTLRGDVLDVMGQDFVRSARAKGLSEFRVIRRHVLKNAFIPSLTMIGLSFGWTLGGTVLVEAVYDWPGIGKYAVDAAVRLDFDPIMGVTLIVGLTFILLNLIVDLLYGFLDPRISYR
jgi:peptide/nickel transport system permease protein